MKADLDILWPRGEPLQIFETEFSFHFCRQVTKALCLESSRRILWREYSPADSATSCLRDTESEMILVVTDPEIVIPAVSLERLIVALGNGHAASGPVFNVTDFPAQQASLSSPYVNISTFLEVSEAFADRENNAPLPVESLDPACILVRRNAIEQHVPPLDVKRWLTSLSHKSLVVDKGALVHRFGDYFSGERDDLVNLVPPSVNRVLDVGCAQGGYGRRLKTARPEVEVVGLELNPILAKTARAIYDEVIGASVEDIQISSAFDLINCGDILEHLTNPWAVLRTFHDWLKPGGYLVLSIPNIGHWSVVRDLLQGQFEYIPVGLLCVSHVRWFTEKSIRQALEEAGFGIDLFKRDMFPPTAKGEAFIQALCQLGYGSEDSLRTNELVVRAVRV
jgi:2-polyprenyl-3-methyl-5-hydroxy-6-metoxy-1,4-benzoquinol methylase